MRALSGKIIFLTGFHFPENFENQMFENFLKYEIFPGKGNLSKLLFFQKGSQSRLKLCTFWLLWLKYENSTKFWETISHQKCVKIDWFDSSYKILIICTKITYLESNVSEISRKMTILQKMFIGTEYFLKIGKRKLINNIFFK